MPSTPSNTRLRQDRAAFNLGLATDLISQVNTLAQDLKDSFGPSDDYREVEAAMQAWAARPNTVTDAAETVTDFIETTMGAAEVAVERGMIPPPGFGDLRNTWESLSDAYMDWQNNFSSATHKT